MGVRVTPWLDLYTFMSWSACYVECEQQRWVGTLPVILVWLSYLYFHSPIVPSKTLSSTWCILVKLGRRKLSLKQGFSVFTKPLGDSYLHNGWFPHGGEGKAFGLTADITARTEGYSAVPHGLPCENVDSQWAGLWQGLGNFLSNSYVTSFLLVPRPHCEWGSCYFTPKHLWHECCFELESVEKWQTSKQLSVLPPNCPKAEHKFPFVKVAYMCLPLLCQREAGGSCHLGWRVGTEISLYKTKLSNESSLPAVSPYIFLPTTYYPQTSVPFHFLVLYNLSPCVCVCVCVCVYASKSNCFILSFLFLLFEVPQNKC
jgi:hypothetical protein